jgi:hypothetical protein
MQCYALGQREFQSRPLALLGCEFCFFAPDRIDAKVAAVYIRLQLENSMLNHVELPALVRARIDGIDLRLVGRIAWARAFVVARHGFAPALGKIR